MHPIDNAIYTGTLTRQLLLDHATRPLPPIGDSYWGDAMRACISPEGAAVRAANQMGVALASLSSVIS